MTGCLYLSTNSAKALRSPCLTRSIRAASGSVMTVDIIGQHTKTRKRSKVAQKGLRASRPADLQASGPAGRQASEPTPRPQFARAHPPLSLPSPSLLPYLLRVPTLLEKIEANAALRLALPPGRTPVLE